MCNIVASPWATICHEDVPQTDISTVSKNALMEYLLKHSGLNMLLETYLMVFTP